MDVDVVMFIVVFFVCSYFGLVKEGFEIFDLIVRLSVDYFLCLVDFFGWVGYLDEVERLVKMSGCGVDVLWGLFSVCVVYGDLKLGKMVVGLIIE